MANLSTPSYVIFASYGNDSIALIQWAYESGLKDVVVAYSDTGWAASWWDQRVIDAQLWAMSLGFSTHILHSEGMPDLARRKKAWPRGGGGRFQFCTYELKEKPALEWLDQIDPNKEVTCMVGIRREESANRANFPEWTAESEGHGGRELHAPLVRYNEKMRNELIAKTPFRPLPTRSKECWPCVNARKAELKLLDDETIIKVETLEKELGINSNGNARVMFSPKRHNGAIGIQQVVDDASKNNEDMFASTCDGGWCGS